MLKLFARIFKRRKVHSEQAKPSSSTKKRSTNLSEVEMLLKDAAKLKGSNIDKAIELVKHAIELTPTNNQQYYFKLANYLHMAGSIDGAYKIYDDLMADLKEDQIIEFNRNKSIIYEKLCTMNYKTGRYQDYMACYFYWLYNHMIGLAFHNKAKELNKILKTKNKLVLLSPAKVEGCFKKLQKDDIKGVFNEKLAEYVNSVGEELSMLSKSKIKPEELIDENSAVCTLFKKYNSESEMKFYVELNSLLDENSAEETER